MTKLTRVHWHWTAGAKGLIQLEADSYHEIVQPDGSWEPGTFKPEDNIAPLKPGKYAAHTLNANSGAIGIACDAMAGAVEHPFQPGSNPLTEAQIETMLDRTAYYCRKFGIPVSPTTTLSHAEVQANLGIPQRNKWDISWLPGMTRVDSPRVVGDELRRRLLEKVSGPIQANFEIQTELQRLGLYDGRVDNICGPKQVRGTQELFRITDKVKGLME